MKKALQSVLVLSLMFIFGASSALAADQIRKRDPKRDGTCRSTISTTDDSFNLAADRSRKRDRTC